MKINKDTLLDILVIVVLPILAAFIVSLIVSGCTVNINKRDIESGRYVCRWEEGTLNCYDNWSIE